MGFFCNFTKIHCVKSVGSPSYSGPYFSTFGQNADQNNSEYGKFLRSDLKYMEIIINNYLSKKQLHLLEML